MAIVSLVAAVIAWMFCPFVGGVVAVITGLMARREIRANPTQLDGDGIALAGLIVGGINVGLWLLVGLLYLLIFLGAISLAILS